MIEVVPAPTRRQDLAAFLRVKRDSISPQQSGLAVEERRHVPGLRREEVAELAGISTTWYTWLEQGREINVSFDVLSRVGNAMLMTPYEVEYMQRLLTDSRATLTLEPEIPGVLRALVEKFEDAPAYVATPCWDLLIWNRFMGELMGYEEKGNRLARNIVYRIFFDPSRRSLYADWEAAARCGCATLRYNYSYYAGDPQFESLLVELMKSPEFVRVWNMHEISPPGMPKQIIRHPSMGSMELQTVQASLDIGHGYALALFDCKRLS